MSKLVSAFEKNPSEKTARAILVYLDKHPMAACMWPGEAAKAQAFLDTM